jgi:predicted amidohydrolase
MKVAAYQAPLLADGSTDALALIRQQVERCEAAGVEILCCPEAVLGGLADYSAQPAAMAFHRDELNGVLAPLASDTVTTIVGFTETDRVGHLYNSAAVFHRGSVAGMYRKLHPAINRSVYSAGDEMPVFTIGGLTFGVIICRDSNFSEPACVMASRGATALFVPTNNGLPFTKASPGIVADARTSDIARATENNMFVIRADVAGRTDHLLSYGSSAIVGCDGAAIATARELSADLIVADLATSPCMPEILE